MTDYAQISYPDSNRIGRFNILHEAFDERAAAMFNLMTVLKVEAHQSGRGKTFYAASDLFQPLAEGEEIPEYRIDSAYEVPFGDERDLRALSSGQFKFAATRQFVIRVPPVSTIITMRH